MRRTINYLELKKLFASFLFVIMITSVFGQNADQKWSVGIMGGKTEYYGDLGNGFFKFNPFTASEDCQ
jgi:hypothetical protein